MGSTSAAPFRPLIDAVGSALKGGGYRSYYNYMNAMRKQHIKAGHSWTEQLELARTAFTLSTQRGMGPAKQAEPLPFLDLVRKDFDDTPLNPGGPVSPKHVMILMTYFVDREL